MTVKISEVDTYLRPKRRWTAPLAVLFIAIAIFHVATGRTLVKKFHLPIPELVFVAVSGTIWGVLARHFETVQMHMALVFEYHVDDIVTPLIVFHVAFSVDYYSLKKYFIQICVASIVVQLATVTMLTFITPYVLGKTRWSWPMRIIFSALFSMVDSREVIDSLSGVALKTKRISLLLEGESVFGLILSICIAEIALDCYMRHEAKYVELDVMILVAMNVTTIAGGTIFGLLCGFFGGLLFNLVSNNIVTVICFSPALVILVHYICKYYLYMEPIVATAAMGIMFSRLRISLPVDTEQLLVKYWESLSLLSRSILVFSMSILLSLSIFSQFFAMYDAAYIILLFGLSAFLRFFVFWVCIQILSKIGFQLPFRSMVVVVVSGALHPIAIKYIYVRGYKGNLFYELQFAYMYLGVQFFITHLTNLPASQIMIKCLGLLEVNWARQENMVNCIKHVMVKRDTLTGILKMDRMLSDANWPLIMKETQLENPYNVISSGTDDPDFGFKHRPLICPECFREVPREIDPEQFAEMRRESSLRIVKAKRICYNSLFVHGLISKRTALVLSEASEIAMDSGGTIGVLDALEEMSTVERKFPRFVKATVTDAIGPRDAYPPSHPWRRRSYHILFSVPFEIFLYGIIILSIVHISLMWILPFAQDENCHFLVAALLIVVALVYLIEIILQLMVYSKAFFKSIWNWSRTIIFCCILTEITLLLIRRPWYHPRHKDGEALMIFFAIMKCLRLFTFVRLLRFCKPIYTGLLNYWDLQYDSSVAAFYDTRKAFVLGQQHVIETVDYMINYKALNSEITLKLNMDKATVLKQLAVVEKSRPWVPSHIKTKMAIQMTLEGIKDSIYELRVSGWIDDIEYKKLMTTLQDRIISFKSMKRITPPSPKALFNEIPWMGTEENLNGFLYQNVMTKIINPGDVVVEVGKKYKGIYILVIGLLKLQYEPNIKHVQKMKESGAIPVIDFISSCQFENKREEYVFPGNSFGEIGVLTNRPSDCSIICELPSQLMFIRKQIMNEAKKISTDAVNGLEPRMWKFSCSNLVVSLLMKVPIYQNLLSDKVKVMLQRSFVPQLSNYETFVVTEYVEDIILIEGIVGDIDTREIYVGPCYLPRTIKTIVMPKSAIMDLKTDIETKFLVIPTKESDEYDVMAKIEELSVTKDKAKTKILPSLLKHKKPGMLKIGKGAKTLTIATEAIQKQTGSHASRPAAVLRTKSQISDIRSIYMEKHKPEPSVIASIASRKSTYEEGDTDEQYSDLGVPSSVSKTKREMRKSIR